MSPGTGGLRAEFLTVLGEKMNDEQMEMLQSFGMRYLNGNFPAWFYKVWLTVQTLALNKTRANTSVCPIGMRNPLVKTFNKEMIVQNRGEILNFLEPQQLAMSKVGGAQISILHQNASRKETIICCCQGWLQEWIQ